MNASSVLPKADAKYQPLLKLGRGGMADVYLAVSRARPGFERLCVLKRLRVDLVGSDDDGNLDPDQFVAMFHDEARLSMLLQHPNVVHTYDAFEEAGALYLVMEYIEGHSLNTLARELSKIGRALSPVHAARIAADVLAGLHYAHELTDMTGAPLNIVHRDVSPQNVIISFDGTVKLLDFGVAKASFRSAHTRAGTMKGKARYMAPEQVVNRGLDRRADVYSIGVILWERLANRPLVNGATEVEQLMNVLQTPSPRLSTVVPDIDPELDAIVAKALARAADERYATAAEMREALVDWLRRAAPAPEDLAGLLTDVFAAQRKEMQAQVRAKLAPAEARPAVPEKAVSELGASLLLLDDDQTLGAVSSSKLMSTPFVARSSPPAEPVASSRPSALSTAPVPPPRRSRLPLVLGLVAIAAVVLFFVTRRAPPPPPPAPVLAETPAVAPSPAPTTPTPPVVATTEADASAPVASAPSAPAPTVAFVPRSLPGRPAWHSPTPAAPTVPVVSAAAAATPSEPPGFLTIETYPWTKVAVDGRPIGTTPIVRASVPAGTHTLTMENAEEGIHESATITVKSGEPLSKRFAFGQ